MSFWIDWRVQMRMGVFLVWWQNLQSLLHIPAFTIALPWIWTCSSRPPVPVRQEVGSHTWGLTRFQSSKSQDHKTLKIYYSGNQINSFSSLQSFPFVSVFVSLPLNICVSTISFTSSCYVCLSLCVDFPLSLLWPPHLQGFTKYKDDVF